VNLFILLLLALGSAPATDDTDPPAADPASAAEDTDDTDAPSSGVAAPCPQDRGLGPLRQALTQAGAAARSRDIDRFVPAYERAMLQAACLRAIPTPDDAAALHAASYLSVAIEGDRDVMAVALLGATTVPGAQPPDWLVVPEGAVVAESRPWVPVQPPSYTALFVDGLPMSSRPVSRPALYQAVGPGGEVLWTRWLQGDQPLPDGFVEDRPTEPRADRRSGAEVLDQVTTLLAEGEYQAALDLAIPAAATYPELQSGFRAAADLAADQLRRSKLDPLDVAGYSPYAPRPRRGALRRGDDRQGFLLGFDVGLPTGLHGEWKLGRSAVDGVGLRVGGALTLYGSGTSVFPGVDTSLYLDWNLTRRWQLQTTVLGVFWDTTGSPYLNLGVAAQYDPPSPLEITVGARLGVYGAVPQASVGFLW